MTSLQSVDSYRDEIIAALTPLPPEDIPVSDADGTVLAADVSAAWPLPGFDNSAMDGYAVIAADVASASKDNPVRLPVAAEVPAGDTTRHTLTPGHSIKIMTGALLPDGADAVIPVEWTDGGAETVTITDSAEKGNAVRRAGDDAQPGDLLLRAGTRLGPAQIGVLAAAGHGAVLARRRPRVTVISTGNELSEPGSPLVPGRIWDSNSYMLAAAARHAGCEVIRHTVVRDDPAAVLAAIELAAATADALITSGGVSMGGEHDVVKAALTVLGSVKFRKVAMQPGMPQGFGLLGSPPRVPIFTLPGNPVSALVSFRVFVAPALRAIQDLPAELIPIARPKLSRPVTSPAGRRSFLRGVHDRQAAVVEPLTGQGSHQIASAARANVLIIVPEQDRSLPAGAIVDVLDLP
ncbi:MAG TPA: gephyrin-like molybdotransferase Glp [Streptosporangiaceae bacterium]|nr:gephyrin-like molybdotransferase Glp [Streptosporangiaceae bacterium]